MISNVRRLDDESDSVPEVKKEDVKLPFIEVSASSSKSSPTEEEPYFFPEQPLSLKDTKMKPKPIKVKPTAIIPKIPKKKAPKRKKPLYPKPLKYQGPKSAKKLPKRPLKVNADNLSFHEKVKRLQDARRFDSNMNNVHFNSRDVPTRFINNIGGVGQVHRISIEQHP